MKITDSGRITVQYKHPKLGVEHTGVFDNRGISYPRGKTKWRVCMSASTGQAA